MTGISRRQLLAGAAGGALMGAGASRAAVGDDPLDLVVVVADGGWDLTFVFDPKPGVPTVDGPYVDLVANDPLDTEVMAAWGDIEVTVNQRRRPSVARFFDDWGHLASVVNGVWVGSVSHWIGRRRILSGFDDLDAPDLATVVGSVHGADRPMGMVDLSNVGRLGAHSARVARGGVRSQLGQLLRPDTRYPLPDGSDRGSLALRPAEASAIEDWLGGASTAPTSLVGRGYMLEQRLEARRRAWALAERADDLVIPSPGRPSVASVASFAASLLATRTCASVMIDSGSRWDTHLNHTMQHAHHDKLFAALSTLLGELQVAGVLDHTLVVVLSEMVRTPRRNAQGGTDHWPYTGVMLLGAGVRGGGRFGGTDEHLVGLPADPRTGRVGSSGDRLRYDHLVAGILRHVGVDAARHMPGVVPFEGFSLR